MTPNFRDKDIYEMSPSEWLSYKRNQLGFSGKVFANKKWIDEFINRLPLSKREKTSKVWSSRLGLTMAEIHDELMQEYLEQFKPILLAEEKKVADSTFFGVLPTCEFNAYAGFTARGDRIAIFHEALCHTLAYWSHWYVRMTIDEHGFDYLREDSKKFEDALSYILSVWNGKAPKTQTLPDIYPITTDSWELSECLVISAICFVIGHELGHIIKSHKYTDSKARNHAMEYEADRIGLSICIRHSISKTVINKKDNYFCKFMLYAPLFVTAVISLFGDSESDTHPSPSNRRVQLIDAYEYEIKNLCYRSDVEYQDFMDEADPDLLKILNNNSIKLFSLFSKYRAKMETVDVEKSTTDFSDLLHELNNNRPRC